MTKNGKELILEDNRVVVLIINDCIGVLSGTAGVIDSRWHACSSPAICRSSATWGSSIVLTQAVSFVGLFFLPSKLSSARFVGQEADLRWFEEGRSKAEPIRSIKSRSRRD